MKKIELHVWKQTNDINMNQNLYLWNMWYTNCDIYDNVVSISKRYLFSLFNIIKLQKLKKLHTQFTLSQVNKSIGPKRSVTWALTTNETPYPITCLAKCSITRLMFISNWSQQCLPWPSDKHNWVLFVVHKENE